jgi:arginase
MNNIKVFTVDQANNDPQSVYEEINQNKLPTHFSFDIDSVDPKFVSSTGTPVKNGLTVQSAKELVRYFTEDNKTMLKEFVEVNPCLGNYEKSYDTITEILDEIYLD